MELTKHWAARLDDYAIDLAWSPDGALLAAASAAGPVALLAAADGARRHDLPGHDGGTNCLAWQPPNPNPASQHPLLATGGQDGAVKLWDAAAGQHTATAALGGAWVEHLAWSPAAPMRETTSLATADASPAPPPEISNSKFQITPPAGAASSTPSAPPAPDRDGGVAAPVLPECDHAAATPKPARKAPNALLFAAAGKQLAALRADGSVAHRFPPAPKTITALAAQPARPERVERARPEPACPEPVEEAERAGGCVAAAHFGGVRLWDADDFVLQKELPYANGILALVWSPDRRWLVSGNQDPSVHLWLPAKNDELHMSGYETKVTALAFDRAARWLATGGGRDACVWDCAGAGPEGREPLMFPHDAPVRAVAFQHTHGLLASAAADGTVCLWSVDRRQPLRATVKMPAPATKLAWSPDDTLLAIGTESGAVYVLRCVA